MKRLKNATYIGNNNRPSLVDLTVPEDFNQQIILFLHGYMGFKDWGAWNLMEKHFTDLGFGFCKFNFSHNGGTIENGIDFPDLESFAENNYSTEVKDVDHMLSWLETQFENLPKIHLLGHSRGGGIALLKGNDPRISSVISLAGICSVAQRFSDEKMMLDWKEKGIRYVKNQRTLQEMPHNYSQALDFFKHKNLLDIEKACKILRKPVLAIHGDKDTSVSMEEGLQIARWTNTELVVVENADHVFGASHPWKLETLPGKLQEVCDKITAFIQQST